MNKLLIMCSNCGEPLNKSGYEEYYCPECGSIYQVKNSKDGKIDDFDFLDSNTNFKNAFVVHNKLKINGTMNRIKVIKKTREGIHVNNLNILGSLNSIRVVFTKNATYENNGRGNDID